MAKTTLRGIKASFADTIERQVRLIGITIPQSGSSTSIAARRYAVDGSLIETIATRDPGAFPVEVTHAPNQSRVFPQCCVPIYGDEYVANNAITYWTNTATSWAGCGKMHVWDVEADEFYSQAAETITIDGLAYDIRAAPAYVDGWIYTLATGHAAGNDEKFALIRCRANCTSDGVTPGWEVMGTHTHTFFSSVSGNVINVWWSDTEVYYSISVEVPVTTTIWGKFTLTGTASGGVASSNLGIAFRNGHNLHLAQRGSNDSAKLFYFAGGTGIVDAGGDPQWFSATEGGIVSNFYGWARLGTLDETTGTMPCLSALADGRHVFGPVKPSPYTVGVGDGQFVILDLSDPSPAEYITLEKSGGSWPDFLYESR